MAWEHKAGKAENLLSTDIDRARNPDVSALVIFTCRA
jgi:hypothetical protein